MSDPIFRLNAALEDRYRIERELGEGGMATVYLADDLRHERMVALKVLKPELAAVVGAERFLTEIKTTANLQHPHILPLFDSGEADGFLFYAMPYVEGETLRGRIEREKQLGVKDAVAITRKIASALDYAHGRGVVHRDIKPANILLSEQGEPLVADFGIALAVAQAGAGRITETGLSLGTPHYMSPEQATGDRDVDPRSDVYALGCVLYEMLAGQPPFSARTAQAILVQILTTDAPPVTLMRRTVPAHVEGALLRSLEKLPADRFDRAADFAAALDDESFRYEAPTEASTTTATARVGVPEHAGRRGFDRRLAAVGSSAVFMALLAAWGWLRPVPPPAAPGVPTRAQVTGLDMVVPSFGGWRLAISRDAATIVAGHWPDLYARAANDLDWRLVPNTDGATNPTISPDGQWVAFTADGEIRKVPLTGGPALPIAEGNSPHWAENDTLVFTTRAGGLYRVSSSGGDPELLWSGAEGVGVARPFLLPGGRAVVFGTAGDVAVSQIGIFEIESGAWRVLVPSGNHPRYIETGHLIYGHSEGALMGVPFDLETLQVTGTPITLLPRLRVYGGGASQFAVSSSGTMIFALGGPETGAEERFVEVDLDGTERPLPLAPGELERPRYAPDGSRIAYDEEDQIRIYDVVSGANPVFSGEEFASNPAWSASGLELYYRVGRFGSGYQARRPASGVAPAVSVSDQYRGQVLDVAAGDSLGIALRSNGPENPDLHLVRMIGDSLAYAPFLEAEWDEYGADISPDGRWVAYGSSQSGEPRVYVHSFPRLSAQYPISSGPGTDPVWAPDGSRIYYRDGVGFFAVDVSTAPDFTVGTPRLLFEGPTYTMTSNLGWVRNWDIHPEGDRFVMVSSPELDSEGRGISVGLRGLDDVVLVVNWFEEVRQRMGG